MSPIPPLDRHGLGLVTRIRTAAIEREVAWRTRRARKTLMNMPELWQAICDYERASNVTGSSMSDYLTLYEQIRLHRPREVLELGTGVSSVVLAHALLANEADGLPLGRVTSMEEDIDWYQLANKVIPDRLNRIIEVIHSPKVDGYYKIFRGVQYSELPDRPYDFIFSDGPERHSPVNGDKLFNIDLILVILRSEHPIRAVVDNHYMTFYVLQKTLGTDLARYSPSHRLMFVGPATKHDVRNLKKENFLPDLRICGRTELKLRMAR